MPDPYELMLSLINEERGKAGAAPVAMGSNPVAQIHADNSLANCISSHWSVDGLNPEMRYTLAGGHQANNENLYGSDYCKLAGQGYARIGGIAEEARAAMRAWMESPGHRETILRPRQRLVNIGLAWDAYNFHAVQVFEGDFVEFTSPPAIEGGVLTMEGSVRNGASLEHGDHFRFAIMHRPPPQPLTQGQIARVYSSCEGRKVALLSFRSAGTVASTTETCLDPYDMPPDTPAPASAMQAREFWEDAYARHRALPRSTPVTIAKIKMSRWELDGDRFAVSADLSGVLAEYGPGVYKVAMFGVLDGEATLISEYAIFHEVPRPAGYGAEGG